jgi:amidohydrolase
VVGALGDVVSRAPTLLSRLVDPLAGLSLVWGQVHAGSATNVVPERGTASGSVRVLDAAVWEGAGALVTRVLRQLAEPYGVTVQVDYVRGVPPALNDPGRVAVFGAAAARALGDGMFQEATRSMGAEDFAWFLQRVPGALGRLGVRRPGTAQAPDLHRGDFDVDEAAIGCGVAVLVHAALLSAADAPAPRRSSTATSGA